MSNNSIRDDILSYASNSEDFGIDDLLASLNEEGEVNRSTLRRQLSMLVKESELDRVGHGVYTKSRLPEFKPVQSRLTADIYSHVRSEYPLLRLCVYEGSSFSHLQHHLSPNQITYVEVERDGVEVVFNLLSDQSELPVYIRPGREMIYNYIDLDMPAIFVKPLVTEAPLQQVDDIPAPTLEKLLVDIQRDPDFFYLQGQELLHIMDSAHMIYTVNTTKLLRYATRRGVKEETLDLLSQLDIQRAP